jgi:hypothetical protein
MAAGRALATVGSPPSAQDSAWSAGQAMRGPKLEGSGFAGHRAAGRPQRLARVPPPPGHVLVRRKLCSDTKLTVKTTASVSERPFDPGEGTAAVCALVLEGLREQPPA